MNDAHIIAKQKDYDVFNALEAMRNETFRIEIWARESDRCLHHWLLLMPWRGYPYYWWGIDANAVMFGQQINTHLSSFMHGHPCISIKPCPTSSISILSSIISSPFNRILTLRTLLWAHLTSHLTLHHTHHQQSTFSLIILHIHVSATHAHSPIFIYTQPHFMPIYLSKSSLLTTH